MKFLTRTSRLFAVLCCLFTSALVAKAGETVPFTLEYSAGFGGSLTGNPSQMVDLGNNGTPVEALPDTGYHFTQWDDGSTQNPRTDTGVTGDLSVTAVFTINTYTLDYSAGSGGSISGFGFALVNHFFSPSNTGTTATQ